MCVFFVLFCIFRSALVRSVALILFCFLGPIFISSVCFRQFADATLLSRCDSDPFSDRLSRSVFYKCQNEIRFHILWKKDVGQGGETLTCISILKIRDADKKRNNDRWKSMKELKTIFKKNFLKTHRSHSDFKTIMFL